MREIFPERKFYPKSNEFINKVYEAGFTDKEVDLIFKTVGMAIDSQKHASVTKLPTEFFTFIRGSIDESETRVLVVSGLFANPYLPSGSDSMATLLLDLHRKSKTNPNITLELRDVAMPRDPEEFGRAIYQQKLRISLQILRDDSLFNIFSKNVKKLVSFIDFMGNPNVAWSTFEGALNTVHKGSYKAVFLKDLNESALLDINSLPTHNGLGGILAEESKARYANQVLRSLPSSWYDKLQALPKTVTFMGFPVIKANDLEHNLIEDYIKKVAHKSNLDEGKVRDLFAKLPPQEKYKRVVGLMQERGVLSLEKYKNNLKDKLAPYEILDKQALDRIRRRESSKHPLNTLGIAKTVGYEIEFAQDMATTFMLDEGLFEMLGFVGFKPGLGGTGAYETSPGPFYDPLTANTIFETYCDAGIIDLTKYKSFTYHFNVGIKNEGIVVPLIRAMYLTGAAYDSYADFVDKGLRTYGNRINGVAFTECKTFDAITREGFLWNMKSASFLSWALDASHGVGKSRKTRTKWHNELGQIWRDYKNTIDEGLRSIDLDGHLDQIDHGNDAKIVRRQLQKIFPAKSAYYKDLSKINNYTNPDILEIYAQRKYWPNLAYFAREVTNDAVTKIELLADNFEREVEVDIKEIEKRSVPEKSLVAKFREKYNVYSYVEVRDLFVKPGSKHI